ncbi:MAG: NifB/NifX family molybdenum-iron cluster-binding protein [Candidatus Thorarchaeota archaeon]
MKIAVSAQGETLDSPVDPRFGRCLFFLIHDSTKKTVQIVPNTAVEQMHGAGINAGQKMLDLGIEVVLTGNLGPNAFNVLMQGGIKAFRANPGDVNQAIRQYLNGELSLITLAGPGHAGLGGRRGGGHGMGRGGGRGRGQGRNIGGERRLE